MAIKKEILEALKNYKPSETDILKFRLGSLQSQLKMLNEEERRWRNWSNENQKRHKDDREYGTTDVYSRISSVEKQIKEIENQLNEL